MERNSGNIKRKRAICYFISRDLKKDWITEYSGIRCGPRIELLHEFHETSPGKSSIFIRLIVL